jgi:hypothetical protein
MNGYSFIQKGQETHPLILGREDSAFSSRVFNRRFSAGFAGKARIIEPETI